MGSQTAGSPLSIAVIGHVNHGKTALVRALTGIETDRLAEEKARGLSITLGFAWREYPSGVIDFLDAPGHEDFIRAMVMATTGARAALLVVSATEGFARQTREHLRVAQLLGLQAGIVAVSKVDLLADGEAAEVRARLEAELAGTFLAGAPIVACSAQTGAGLETLHGALETLVVQCPPAAPAPGPILPLDRVFTVAGTGTVVTGALQGEALAVGARALLMPSGREVTIRQLQVHGTATDTALPGGRVAAALRGVSVDEVPVGEILCAPDALAPSLLVDVEVSLLTECTRPLKSGDELRVLWGARQDMARIRIVGDAPLAPGARGFAQLRVSGPVAAFAGQRAILRRPSPPETIGGALVLDPRPPKLKGRAEARHALLDAAAAGDLPRIAGLLADRHGGVVSIADAARLARRRPEDVRAALQAFEPLSSDVLAPPAVVAFTRDAYLARLADAHRAAPHRAWVLAAGLRRTFARTIAPSLLEHVERRLMTEGQVRMRGGDLALASHDPLANLSPVALDRLHDIERQIREGGASPPDLTALAEPSEDDPTLAELLVDQGSLVALRNVALRQTLLFHAEVFDQALATLRAAFPPPMPFATGAAREALGTSRKFIVPLLEHLDARGDTIREGDARRIV